MSQFKELPILFSGPMVRALLDGSKTQTRRVVKGQSTEWDHFAPEEDVKGREFFMVCGQPEPGNRSLRPILTGITCPYGQLGDRLWVRETFFAYGRWETRYSEKKGRDEWHFIDMTLECDRAYQYAADNPDIPLAKGRGPLPGWYKRPAIHMPRRACRAVLDNTGVRVERLQDISDVDAMVEGVDAAKYGKSHRYGYSRLWEEINGPGSWDANPWVWVIEFKRVTP